MCSENVCYALLSETVEEMRELLKTILQQFLEIVEPLEAELLDLLYAKDVLTFSDYESVRETKPGYSRKDRVSVGQGLGFWSFPVPFFFSVSGHHLFGTHCCPKCTNTVQVQISPQNLPVCPSFSLELSTLSKKRWRVCAWLVECRRMLLDRAKAGWGEVRGLRGAFEIQAREGGGWGRRSLCCCGEY